MGESYAPRRPDGIKQVGDQAVLEGGSKRENVLLRTDEVPGRQEKPTQGDEYVTSPASRPSRCEMGQSGCQRRCGFTRVERSGLDDAMQLNGNQSKVMGERVTSRHKLRALFDGGAASGLVGCKDDDGEVLWPKERRNALLDLLEPLLVPLYRLREVGECCSLPGGD